MFRHQFLCTNTHLYLRQLLLLGLDSRKMSHREKYLAKGCQYLPESQDKRPQSVFFIALATFHIYLFLFCKTYVVVRLVQKLNIDLSYVQKLKTDHFCSKKELMSTKWQLLSSHSFFDRILKYKFASELFTNQFPANNYLAFATENDMLA